MSSKFRRDEILLLFDIDGTLTLPRDIIEPEFEIFLYEKIKPLAKIGIVSGANLEKMLEQLNGHKPLQEIDYIFPENGLVVIENGVEMEKQSLIDHLGEQKIQRFINFVLKYISELELPFKRGTFLEFRNGMMNICPCGRQCSVAERKVFNEFDKIHNIRTKMIEALTKEFQDIDLTYSIGGKISFDAYPKDWDKTFCLRYVTKGTNFKEIHFFGDMTESGGNDHEIYNHMLTIGHKVRNPDETRKILEELFQIQ